MTSNFVLFFTCLCLTLFGDGNACFGGEGAFTAEQRKADPDPPPPQGYKTPEERRAEQEKIIGDIGKASKKSEDKCWNVQCDFEDGFCNMRTRGAPALPSGILHPEPSFPVSGATATEALSKPKTTLERLLANPQFSKAAGALVGGLAGGLGGGGLGGLPFGRRKRQIDYDYPPVGGLAPSSPLDYEIAPPQFPATAPPLLAPANKLQGALGGLRGNQPPDLEFAPYSKSWVISDNHIGNRISGIDRNNPDGFTKFAGAYVLPNERAWLMSYQELGSGDFIRFDYFEATEDVRLKLCFNDPTFCPWRSRGTNHYLHQNWQRAAIPVPEDTRVILYICENTGVYQGACGLDNVQLWNLNEWQCADAHRSPPKLNQLLGGPLAGLLGKLGDVR